MLPMHELCHNPHLYPVTADLVRASATAPDYLRFSMVCVALGHRINRLGSEEQQSRTALSERFYRFWGLAVRSLNEHLDREDARTCDMVIAGVLTLLLTDVSRHCPGIKKEERPY
jgi:hypothetical protein